MRNETQKTEQIRKRSQWKLVSESTIEVEAGNVVIGPVGVPHKFINSGEGILRTINIHPSPHTIGKWVED